MKNTTIALRGASIYSVYLTRAICSEWKPPFVGEVDELTEIDAKGIVKPDNALAPFIEKMLEDDELHKNMVALQNGLDKAEDETRWKDFLRAVRHGSVELAAYEDQRELSDEEDILIPGVDYDDYGGDFY